MVFHLMFFMFPKMSSIPSVPQLRDPLWDFGFAVLAWLALAKRLSRPMIAAWLVLTAATILFRITEGLMTTTIFTLFIVILAALCQRRFKILVSTVVLAALILPSYGYVKYVSQTLLRGSPTRIFEFKPDFSAASLMASANAMARRSAHAFVLQRVIDLTPSTIPHADRNPFFRALVNHVPRAVWPGKPKEVLGNEFGKEYGFLNADDETTSWNIPWTADFYMTSGFFRPVLYAAVIGLALAVGIGWMSARIDRVFWFGVYVATLFPLFYQESNFSLMTGNVISVLVFLVISYRIALIIGDWIGEKPKESTT